MKFTIIYNMEIRVICIGKIKSKEMKLLVDNYANKINHFNKLSIIELNEVTFKQESNENSIKAMQEEAKQILPYLNNSFNIALCIEAKQLSSEELASKLDHVFTNNTNYKAINFIIGGSYGIDTQIKEQVDLQLSFSKMTFPHQLMRVILLEQIYRAFCINKHISYHK